MATHNEWEVVQVDNEDKNLYHKFFALFENIASMHVLLSFGTMTSNASSLVHYASNKLKVPAMLKLKHQYVLKLFLVLLTHKNNLLRLVGLRSSPRTS